MPNGKNKDWLKKEVARLLFLAKIGGEWHNDDSCAVFLAPDGEKIKDNFSNLIIVVFGKERKDGIKIFSVTSSGKMSTKWFVQGMIEDTQENIAFCWREGKYFLGTNEIYKVFIDELKY